MRTVIVSLAVAGTVLAAFGALFSLRWLILVGAAGLVMAIVMGALAAPSTRRRQ